MSLRNFLKQMEKEKEILHIEDEVSTHFESSFIIKCLDKEGKILLFEKVSARARQIRKGENFSWQPSRSPCPEIA